MSDGVVVADQVVCRAYEWRATPDSDGDGLSLEGYASVFGAPYDVVDWDGEYVEVVEPGAFRKTLREQGGRVRLLLEHGSHPLLGRLPLGHIESIREDKQGLHVRARLHDNWLVKPVRDAIASGALSEMSIGFRPIKQTWEEPTRKGGVPTRRLHEVALREVSAVVWGASPTTSVAVREFVDAMPAEIRSAFMAVAREDSLRDALAGDAVMLRGVVDDTPPVAAVDGTSAGAVVEDEPTSQVTRQDRRRKALILRGVIDESAGEASDRARGAGEAA